MKNLFSLCIAIALFLISNSLSAQCPMTTGLGTSSVAATTVVLNWTPVPGAVRYVIQGRILGGSNLIQLLTNDTSGMRLVTGLKRGTTYEWRMQTVCNPSGTDLSAFSTFDTFTTLDCIPPIPTNTSNITSTSARFNWTQTPMATGYIIAGRLASGGSIRVLTVNGGSTTFKDVAGLVPNKSYIWAVKAVCGLPGAGQSDFSNINSFSTLPSAPEKLFVDQNYENEIKIFPNPTSDRLNVYNNFDNAKLTIFNSLGQIVYLKDNLYPEMNSVDISEINNGVYCVVIENEHARFSELVVVKRD